MQHRNTRPGHTLPGMVNPWDEEQKVNSWKFGVGQTKKQEADEIRAAKAAGRADEYMCRQRWARMIEAEGLRKRAVKEARRARAQAM